MEHNEGSAAIAAAAAGQGDGHSLNAAYAALQQHIQRLWAQQALYQRPLDARKPRYHRTGRAARRAAMRGYGLHKPQRSRCQRSAKKRGVRKVYQA